MPDHSVLSVRFQATEPAGKPDAVRRVFVRDLVVPCRIGVYDHERLAPQRVRISVELDVAEDRRPLADDIGNVVSYEDIVTGIRRLAVERHINLVETLAEEIAAIGLADRRVLRARVTVEKLDVYAEAGSVGVAIERNAPRPQLFHEVPAALLFGPWKRGDA